MKVGILNRRSLAKSTFNGSRGLEVLCAFSDCERWPIPQDDIVLIMYSNRPAN